MTPFHLMKYEEETVLFYFKKLALVTYPNSVVPIVSLFCYKERELL